MASLSEARHSDWIAQAGLAAAPDDPTAAHAATPSWIAALGLNEAETHGGFREASPFGQGAPSPKPQIEPEPAPAECVSAEDEAYMRGYAEGHAEAKRVGDAALAAETARFGELRMGFRALDLAGVDVLAQELNATVLALCEGVLGEYASDAQALTTRCRSAAKRLGAGPREVTLHLHPTTREQINPDAFPGWSFEDDPTLSPGALRLTGADGAVRDGPEDWMRALAEALAA